MPRELPPFEPFTMAELRALYAQRPDQTVQRLVLEIVRYRQVMAEIDGLYKVTHAAWRSDQGDNLIALNMLQVVMNKERQRLL